MIPVTIIVYILMIHFLADFGLQTSDQATLKSTNVKQLTMHVSVYSMVWFVSAYPMLGSWFAALGFAVITFIAHYMTDYVTSRIGKQTILG